MARARRISQAEQDLWLINYLHKYVQIELTNKFFNTKQCINYEYIGTDQRRIPTIIAFLKDIKLIKNELEPNHTWIQNYLNQSEYNKCPDFKKYITKRGGSYYTKKVIEYKDEAFRSILHFEANELIYIFNNQDQFMFKISGSQLRVISKKVYDNINELVLMEYAKREIDEDTNTILSYALNVRFKTLNNFSNSLGSAHLEYLTEQRLSDKIPSLQNTIEIAKRRLKETKILHRYAERLGTNKFQTFLIVRSLDYIKSIAPVWVVGDDNRKVAIAKIVLEGLPEEKEKER